MIDKTVVKEMDIDKYLGKLTKRGYDVSKLIRVEQKKT